MEGLVSEDFYLGPNGVEVIGDGAVVERQLLFRRLNKGAVGAMTLFPIWLDNHKISSDRWSKLTRNFLRFLRLQNTLDLLTLQNCQLFGIRVTLLLWRIINFVRVYRRVIIFQNHESLRIRAFLGDIENLSSNGQWVENLRTVHRVTLGYALIAFGALASDGWRMLHERPCYFRCIVHLTLSIIDIPGPFLELNCSGR